MHRLAYLELAAWSEALVGAACVVPVVAAPHLAVAVPKGSCQSISSHRGVRRAMALIGPTPPPREINPPSAVLKNEITLPQG